MEIFHDREHSQKFAKIVRKNFPVSSIEYMALWSYIIPLINEAG